MLEGLPEQKVQELLKDDTVCVSLFRWLPSLAQQIVMRTLYCEDTIIKDKYEDLTLVRSQESKARYEAALNALKQYHLAQIVSPAPPEGIEILV